MTLYINNNSVTYFDVFRVPNEINRFKGNKNIPTNIYKKQKIYCVDAFVLGLSLFLFKDKRNYTDSFSPNNLKNNDNTILNSFLNWN